jgi:tripartite-type tricarboxylate transporter receptor subunit TctC
MPSIRINAAVAALVAIATPAAAQDWPTRPMTLVFPFAAGSSGDVLARLYAPHLSEILGRQVVIENVGGAGGMTGSARVAKAPPDGYQFVLGTAGTHAQNQTLYKNPLYNAATDFAPVGLVADQPVVLIARKDLPANNLQEFIAYAKANREKMQYGSAGTGSGTHLACALFNAAAGLNITHIPYRGGGPAMQDLVAGRIDYQCSLTAVAVPQIEGNTVKPIAILSRDRSATLPAVASAHEQGLTDFEAYSWNALFMPKGTPAAIVRKLNAAVITTMEMPAVQARMKDIGADLPAPARRTPEYLQEFVASEIEKWAGPIKALGVTAE